MLTDSQVSTIQYLLDEGQLPQYKIAEMSGVSTETVRRIATGVRSNAMKARQEKADKKASRLRAERKARQGKLTEVRDPVGAYIPTPAEIEAHCKVFRDRHHKRLIKAGRRDAAQRRGIVIQKRLKEMALERMSLVLKGGCHVS